MRYYSKCKKIDSLIRELVQQGWIFKWGKKHGRIGPPSFGGKLTIPKTPSDIRAFYEFRKDLKHFIKSLDNDPINH